MAQGVDDVGIGLGVDGGGGDEDGAAAGDEGAGAGAEGEHEAVAAITAMPTTSVDTRRRSLPPEPNTTASSPSTDTYLTRRSAHPRVA